MTTEHGFSIKSGITKISCTPNFPLVSVQYSAVQDQYSTLYHQYSTVQFSAVQFSTSSAHYSTAHHSKVITQHHSEV